MIIKTKMKELTTYERGAFLSVLTAQISSFPVPKPKKLKAKIGETPTIGAPIPLYNPRKP